ncbi:MAG: PQQ-binding-like beta-propeller repeat protein [Candidatus Polarisedimenticolia bacterium]
MRWSLLVLMALFLHSATTEAAAPKGTTASATLPPAWSVQLDGEVEWQRVAPLGQILVKTSGSLSALDPGNGKTLWRHTDLGGLAQDHYEEIPGTTLVVVSDGMARPRAVILDSADGRILFDSRAAGVTQVLSRHFLPQSRALLIFGFREGDPATTMFLADAETGSLRWKNNRLLEGKGKMTQALAAFFQAATNQSGIVGEPMEITADTFLVASTTDLYAVRTGTGEIAWRVPNVRDTRKTRFYATGKAPGVVFVGSEATMSMTSTAGSGGTTADSAYSEYRALRMADGASVWPEPIRLKGGLNDVLFNDRGLILSPGTAGKGKILLCDYRSGESLWGKKGKGLEILGGIINHDWTRAGLVLTTGYDSAWTNKGTQYHLTLLDVENGALRFDEPLRLRGQIVSTQVIPAGLLFTTTSEANILDLKTGQPLLQEGLRSDESLVTTISGRQLYAYSGRDGTLHRLDLDRGTLATLSKTPVRLEEDDAPLSIEADEDRITVISSQNVIAWSPGGDLSFHAYHASPRLPALTRVLLRAEQVRMGMAAAAAGMASATFASASTGTEPGSFDRTVTAAAATGYAQAGQQLAWMSGRYGEAARTRFKATAVAPDFVFMMVQRERGLHGLARVSKATGRIEAIIDLGRDKEPIYDVDAVSNLIYYRSGPSTVAAYRF